MLKGVGLAPRFVFASRLPDISALSAPLKALPLPEDFEAPLVEVDADGTRFYLNDTDQYAHLGATPHNNTTNKTNTSKQQTLEKKCHAKIEFVRRYFGVTWWGGGGGGAGRPPGGRK